jgi:hypothetical protein
VIRYGRTMRNGGPRRLGEILRDAGYMDDEPPEETSPQAEPTGVTMDKV